jgi:hypothetical protein
MPHEMRFSVCHDLVRKADSRHDPASMHTQRCHPPTLRYIAPTIAVFVSEHADFYKPGLVHGVVSRAQSVECYPLDVYCLLVNSRDTCLLDKLVCGPSFL